MISTKIYIGNQFSQLKMLIVLGYGLYMLFENRTLDQLPNSEMIV